MNVILQLRASLMLLALVAITLPTWSHAQDTVAQTQAGPHKIFLPMLAKGGDTIPAPPSGTLPSAIVGTWFTGAIPPSDFYDPTTGHWRDTNGLGQMYKFAPDGSYTYAGFLRIQNGACRSEVSVYKQGTANASGNTVTLTPRIVKTRTVVICGSTSESVTDGPFDPQPLTWTVALNDRGHVQLTIIDNGTTSSFYKQGMAEALVGAWRRGAIRSVNFYDPTTQTFAPQPGEGVWFRFNADGTYSFGEFGFGQDQQGCTLTGWVYLTGTLEVSGSSLTTKPQSGVVRIENACKPGQPQQQPYMEAARSYAWLLREPTTEPTLVLMPLAQFEEIKFTRE
jgi:hypothetical protein